jgi:hypothetical protein
MLFMLNVAVLSVVMLKAVMLSVTVAPPQWLSASMSEK